MHIPGLYFRDEVVWRGRVVGDLSELRATLYEIFIFAVSNRYTRPDVA
jgi:hypothetical protein